LLKNFEKLRKAAKKVGNIQDHENIKHLNKMKIDILNYLKQQTSLIKQG